MGKFYPKLSCFHSPARCFENMLNTANNDLKPSQTQCKSQFCSSQQHAHTVFPLQLVGYLPVPTCRHDWLKDQLHILLAPLGLGYTNCLGSPHSQQRKTGHCLIRQLSQYKINNTRVMSCPQVPSALVTVGETKTASIEHATNLGQAEVRQA